jgi:hypothetical protein
MLTTQRSPRAEYEAILEMWWGSSTIYARVKNVSVTGLFLEISPPLWIGATFLAKMILQPPIQMICTVSRVVPNRGMGVQVTCTTTDDDKRFSKVLNSLGVGHICQI